MASTRPCEPVHTNTTRKCVHAYAYLHTHPSTPASTHSHIRTRARNRYSDDHGETYTSANRFLGNEVSMAELAPGRLIMNGRAGQHPWNPNRYVSYAFDFEVDLESCQHYTIDHITP